MSISPIKLKTSGQFFVTNIQWRRQSHRSLLNSQPLCDHNFRAAFSKLHEFELLFPYTFLTALNPQHKTNNFTDRNPKAMILHIYDPFWAALQINSTCRKSFTFGEGILDSWTPCVPVVFPPLALTHDMKKFKPPPEEGMLDSWAPVSLSCSLLPPRHNATSLVEGRGGGGGLE